MTARRRSRLASLLVIVAVVTAALPPIATAADPAAGYDATYVVRDPAGQPRTDGTIRVGDDLSLGFAAVDGTAVTDCILRLVAVGGTQMQTDGRIEGGACRLDIRLPDFPDPAVRAQYDPSSEGLDLCAWAVVINFADAEPRQLVAADRWQPGDRPCLANQGWEGSLAFRVEPGGVPRPFVSDPPLLSWNPLDWGTGMVPLTLGEPYHLELPAWIVQCQTYFNGEWTTIIRPAHQAGCAQWDVRIPGVLPATLPWDGGPGAWGTDIVIDYTADDGTAGWTLVAQRADLAASDGIFESSLPAIFPTDLARARFVTAGQPWQPEFGIGGGDAIACLLELVTIPPDWPERPLIFTRYDGVVDADDNCTFDLPPMTEWEYHQYFVTATFAGGIEDPNLVFGGNVQGIPPPAPPEIDPPEIEDGGDTEIGVEPGEGQGLVVDVEVEPTDQPTGAQPLAAGPACADRAVSTDLASGGAIPRLVADCQLAPGNYVAVATMIDAAGVVATSERTFTVRAPRPEIVGRTPVTGATGVRRDVQAAIRFDMPVRGVSSRSLVLRDMVTGALVPATVSYNPATWRATLSPTSLLAAGRTYRLEATSRILNADGRSLLPVRWTFKVSTDATAPTFARSPAAGATGVSRTANVVLQFSEPVGGVNGTTLRLRDDATGAWVAATVTYDAALRRATLNPAPTLGGLRTYRVVVGAGIKDGAGNPLSPANWTFKTRS